MRKSYLPCFIYIYRSAELSSQEVYGFSCVARRLAAAFPAKHFGSLEQGQLALLVTALSQLTVICAQRSAQDEVSLLHTPALYTHVWCLNSSYLNRVCSLFTERVLNT